MADAFNPPGVIEPFGIFSNAAWQGDGAVLQIAGQVAWDADGKVVGQGDIAAQTEQVLENVKAIVESAGGGMADIVSVIVYVTDMAGLDRIHAVRARYFEKPYPASTLVQVTGLVHPDLLIEISAVAAIPHDRVKRPAPAAG